MANLDLLSADEVRQLLDYDPHTGVLTWRERPIERFTGKRASQRCANWNRKFSGAAAFTVEQKGYRRGTLLQRKVLAHRIAFLHYHGEWPVHVDHINGDRADNRIANLRSVTNAENCRNQARLPRNTSGATGVVWFKKSNKWLAGITINGRRKHLGLFANFDEAVAARKAAEITYGFHKNHGRKGFS